MRSNATYKRFAHLYALYTMLGKRFAVIRHQSIFAERNNVCTSCLDLCNITSLLWTSSRTHYVKTVIFRRKICIRVDIVFSTGKGR